MRSSWLFVIGIALGALFLWLALRATDLAAISRAFGNANLLWSAPLLISFAATMIVKAMRWRILLRPEIALRSRQLLPAILIGYAGIALLPLQLGEVVRVYVAARNTGARVGALLGSIVLERVLDLLVVMLALALALTAGAALHSSLIPAGYTLASAVVIAFVALAILARRGDWAMRLSDRLTRNASAHFATRLRTFIDHARQGVAALGQPIILSASILLSVLMWLGIGGCVYASLAAVGLSPSPAAVSMTIVCTVLAMSLPATPGYVGTIQAAYVLALTPFGYDPSQVFAASVIYHALIYAASLLAGFFYLRHAGLSVAQLRGSVATGRPID